jgi:hypothetical protein
MREKLLKLVPAIAVLLTVAGCSSNPSVTESQCIAGDWQTVGYRDGVNGLRSTQLLQHQDACVQHDVIPDRTTYMVGWKQGVREYCNPHNAFTTGERGQLYYNVCPAAMDHDFQVAYQNGRELYLARAAVANLERKIVDRENRLEVVRAEIVSSAASQLDPTLTTTQRIELIAYTKRLADEKSRIQAEIPELEDALADRAQHLDALRNTVASVSY